MFKTKFLPASIFVPAGEKISVLPKPPPFSVSKVSFTKYVTFETDFAFFIDQVLSSVFVTANILPLLSKALKSSIYFP